MISMNYSRAVRRLLVFFLFSQCSETENRMGRMRKPRVFSSVLDEQERRVTTVLDNVMRASYSAQTSNVQYWQNRYNVVEYQLGTPEWGANSKFQEIPDFGSALESGYTALQNHCDTA